jgi:two-component system phosphate regulon sensor histidine kinase PhoR
VPDVVMRAVEACRARAEHEGVTLELELPTTSPHTAIDERALEIAVINLVDNAVKYASDGKLVTVSVTHHDGHFQVSVTDRGPGISDDEKRRIFERFVRGRNTNKQRVRGSGIGLALVKHIAEAHGGRAWVEDVRPVGARFVVTVSSRRTFLSGHDGILSAPKW